MNHDLSGVQLSGISDNLPPALSCFKQIDIQGIVTIPEYCPDIGHLLRLGAGTEINDISIFKTPKALSCGGQVLTGCAAFIEGTIKYRIEYIALSGNQPVCSTNIIKHYTTYTVLNDEYEGDIKAIPYIEDICVAKTFKRAVYVSTLILIDAGGLWSSTNNRYDGSCML